MASEIVGHSTLPELASHPDTSTYISTLWMGRKFDLNTVISAQSSISMVDSLLCEDVAASTLPALMVQISAILIKIPTDSPE